MSNDAYPEAAHDGWSIYRYTRFESASPRGKALLAELAATPCGRSVELYVLVRHGGPLSTEDEADAIKRLWERQGFEGSLVVRRDTGPLLSYVREER